MMRFKTFAKLWLIDELENRDGFPYFRREAALKTVVGKYRNFLSRIHSATFNELLKVLSLLYKESESDILDSIRSDYDLYKES